MYAVAVALPILGLIVLLLLLVELRLYQTGRTLISRRRLILRVVAGILLLLLLAAIFVGLFLLGLRQPLAQPRLFLAYWSGCLLVAIILVWVMLADMREVEDKISERRHQLWREMARFVADQVVAKKRSSSDSRGGDRE